VGIVNGLEGMQMPVGINMAFAFSTKVVIQMVALFPLIHAIILNIGIPLTTHSTQT